MDFFNRHDIYFNFLAFGTLLGVLFNLLLAIFLLTLQNKSSGTRHFGFAFLYMAGFNMAYLYAAMYYNENAVFHRYFSVGLIMPAVTHFVTWVLHYPENSHPRLAWVVGVVYYVGAAIATSIFIYASLSANYKYHFTGHYWDFDLDRVSKFVGIMISLYILSVPAFGFWKAYTIKTKERYGLIAIIIALVIAAVTPSILNVASRDGSIERSTFLFSFVLMTIGGFFLMVVIYINSTKDKTSFMGKILGITVVTFLVMMQFMSFYSLRDREKEYDTLRLEYLDRALEGGSKNANINYLVRMPLDTDAIEVMFENSTYKGLNADQKVTFDQYREHYVNSAIFEELRKVPASDFATDALQIVKNTPETFTGYRVSITNYVQSNRNLPGEELKTELFNSLAKIDRDSLVNSNKIGGLENANFREELEAYLQKSPESFMPFRVAIEGYLKNHTDEDGELLKQNVFRYIAPFKEPEERHYRKSSNGRTHYVSFMRYDAQENAVYEAGYSYREYRLAIHPAAKSQIMILFAVLFAIIVVYPLFFKGSLLDPLNNLLNGVRKVNAGDLDVEVPVKVQDEIGFLAGSFNSMVHSIRDAREKLQDYAANLEEKVKERTAELNATLQEVQALKTQQDGDYFLTSLLAKPLFYNANKSKSVTTDFLLKQKKNFEFRNKKSELGGDICVTGTLRLGKPDNYRRYVVALNGDAMGKSMQGAGGSLVMGVVMNSILARSAKNNRIIDTTPEKWLTDVYEELHGVFKTFNGSMVISASVDVIDEESGQMWYFNAEHPYQVLYRNGKATFIEEELMLRKIGLESEIPFQVYTFQLEEGDVIMMGSDGRDDIELESVGGNRVINEDEYLFLKHVEKGRGEIPAIVQEVMAVGNLTDDLSLLRIGFHEKLVEKPADEPRERIIIDIDAYPEEGSDTAEDSDFEELFNRGKKLAREGRHEEALEVLREAYTLKRDYPALNKILAVLTFKGKEYRQAVEILDSYLHHDPNIVDFWLYLSIAHKRTGDYEKALEAANKVYELNPDRVPNLIQLADLYSKLGDKAKARSFLDKALDLDPQNRQAQTLQSALV